MHLLIVFYQLQNPRRAYLFRLKHPSPVNQDIVKGIVVKPEIPGGGILSHAQLQGNIRLLKRILSAVQKYHEAVIMSHAAGIFPLLLHLRAQVFVIQGFVISVAWAHLDQIVGIFLSPG